MDEKTSGACLSVRRKACMMLASLTALSLAACAVRTAQETAVAGERLQGRGFSIAAPAGDGWSIGSLTPEVIEFHKHPGKPVERPDVAPYTLSAGAVAFADNTAADGQGEEFIRAARNILARRLSAPDRDNVSLDVAPVKLHEAACAAYRAVQVDRYFPEKIEERNEYAYRGLLCVHPSSPAQLVQVFYNEQFLRESPPAQRVNTTEAQAFFSQLQWTALPPR